MSLHFVSRTDAGAVPDTGFRNRHFEIVPFVLATAPLLSEGASRRSSKGVHSSGAGTLSRRV